MSRLSLVLVLVVCFANARMVSARSQAALDQVGPLEAMLRVYPDEHWSVMNDNAGTPMAFQLVPVTNGVPDPELNPATAAQLSNYQVQDMVVYTTTMMHPGSQEVATQIQTRLMVFPDAAAASNWLAGTYNEQVPASAGGEFDPQLALIDPMPTSEYPMVGWTQLTDFVTNPTEEYSGMASTVRYQAQNDRTVVSVQVTGPFVDFNFDLALALIDKQIFCLNESPYCAGTTIAEATSGSWETVNGVLTFVSDGSEARWMFPVEEPVRTPDVSVSL